jgi:hypothetical protein
MLVGDEESVKAGIDSKGNGRLGSNDRFRAAQASMHGDSLGYFFLDGQAYLDWASSIGQASASASPAVAVGDVLRKLMPSWMLFRLQARGDSLAVESVFPSIETKVQRENRVSAVAPHVPATTIAIGDVHDFGAHLLEIVELYRNNPSTRDAFRQVDQAVAIAGGFDTLLGWMKDASVVVTRDASTIHGGLVFTAKDRAAGDRFLATLRSFAVLGGGQAGIKVRDEQHGDKTITIIDFGDLRDIGAMAGVPSSLPVQGHFEIAYASTPDVIVLGIGDVFVKSVLDAGAGTSLADNDRFKSLIARVGDRNVGAAFVDLTAVRELIETAAAPQPQFGDYVRDIKPYVLPFDAYVQASVIDGDRDRSTGVVVVK